MESTPLQVRMLAGLPPICLAFAGARHSRSADSITSLLTEASNVGRSAERLGQIFNAFNHASVGDMAQVAVDLEGVSMLGAMYTFDHRLVAGQERSTRFQDFSARHVFAPTSLTSGALAITYQGAVENLFDAYDQVLAAIKNYLSCRYQDRRAEIGEKKFEATVAARSFDIARYLLPIGTQTSLFVQASAREWQHIIRSLKVHQLTELRDLASRIEQTLCSAAYDPRVVQLEELEARLTNGSAQDPAYLQQLQIWPFGDELVAAIKSGQLTTEHVALMRSMQAEQDHGIQTLLTHSEPLEYLAQVRAIAFKYADKLGLLKGNASTSSETPNTYTIDMGAYAVAASLLFEVVPGLSFERAYKAIRLHDYVWRDILNEVDSCRPERTHAPRAYELAGYTMALDTIIDVGAFRDLNRHRAWTRIPQDIGPQLGYAEPEFLQEAGVLDVYRAAADNAFRVFYELYSHGEVGADAVYVLPLATRMRFVAAADLRQWFYILELRSKPGGHQCYRRWTQQVWDQLRSVYFHDFRNQVRLVPYDYDKQFFDRN